MLVDATIENTNNLNENFEKLKKTENNDNDDDNNLNSTINDNNLKLLDLHYPSISILSRSGCEQKKCNVSKSLFAYDQYVPSTNVLFDKTIENPAIIVFYGSLAPIHKGKIFLRNKIKIKFTKN